MSDDQTVDGWWIACVTFERRDAAQNAFLPEHCQGAVGWMACRTVSGDEVRDLIEFALRAVGLRLVEIADQARPRSFDYVRRLDDHLANNIVELEEGKSVVWGTIVTYVADGEA